MHNNVNRLTATQTVHLRVVQMRNPIIFHSSAYLGGFQAYQHLGKGIWIRASLPSRQSSVGWCLRAVLSQQLCSLSWARGGSCHPAKEVCSASQVPACPLARRPLQNTPAGPHRQRMCQRRQRQSAQGPSQPTRSLLISLTWPTLQGSPGIKDTGPDSGGSQTAHELAEEVQAGKALWGRGDTTNQHRTRTRPFSEPRREECQPHSCPVLVFLPSQENLKKRWL